MASSGYSRTTTRLAVNVDLFLSKMTGTWPWISREVHHVDILSHFVLNLVLNLLPSKSVGVLFFQDQKFSYLPQAPNAAVLPGYRLALPSSEYPFRCTLVASIWMVSWGVMEVFGCLWCTEVNLWAFFFKDSPMSYNGSSLTTPVMLVLRSKTTWCNVLTSS